MSGSWASGCRTPGQRDRAGRQVGQSHAWKRSAACPSQGCRKGRQAGRGGAGQGCGHCHRAGSPVGGQWLRSAGSGARAPSGWAGCGLPPGPRSRRAAKCPWPPALPDPEVPRASLHLTPDPAAGELWAKGRSVFNIQLAKPAGWPGLLRATGHAGATHLQGIARGDAAQKSHPSRWLRDRGRPRGVCQTNPPS